MKKMFNRSLFAVLAAALVTAALITCASPLDGISPGEDGGGGNNQGKTFRPPAGMGYITLKLTNNARSTFAPNLPNINTLDYRIWVEDKTNSNAVVFDTEVDNNGDPVPYDDLDYFPVMLLPGTSRYKVHVTAYNPGTTAEIGYGAVDNVSVSAGGGDSINVYLEPFTNGVGNGTFKYNITLPSNNNLATGTFSAVLNVKEYPGGGQTSVPAGLKNHSLVGGGNNNTGGSGETLPSGFYYVTIALDDPGIPLDPPTVTVATPPALQGITITHIIYIYQNQITTLAQALDPLNSIRHMVTYDENGGDALSSTSFGPFEHGSTLVAVTDEPATPTHSTPGYTFNSWHRSATTTSKTKWIFDNSTHTVSTATRLIGPITLYAIWDSTLKVALSITPGWVVGDTPPSLAGGTTYSFTQADFYNEVATQTVTIEFDDLDGFTIVQWHGPFGDLGSGNSITLDNTSDIRYFTLGPKLFSVTVAKSGKSFNISFTLNVTAE